MSDQHQLDPSVISEEDVHIRPPRSSVEAGKQQDGLTAKVALLPISDAGCQRQESMKKASAVHSYFKENKFSGERSSNKSLQPIHHTIMEYNICFIQLDLTDEQKADYFMNAFSGCA